jgi:hypothetical protein
MSVERPEFEAAVMGMAQAIVEEVRLVVTADAVACARALAGQERPLSDMAPFYCAVLYPQSDKDAGGTTQTLAHMADGYDVHAPRDFGHCVNLTFTTYNRFFSMDTYAHIFWGELISQVSQIPACWPQKLKNISCWPRKLILLRFW